MLDISGTANYDKVTGQTDYMWKGMNNSRVIIGKYLCYYFVTFFLILKVEKRYREWRSVGSRLQILVGLKDFRTEILMGLKVQR